MIDSCSPNIIYLKNGGGEKLRRKFLIGTVCGITLAVLITAIFIPAIAQTNQDPNGTSGNSIVYLTGGIVTLNLPPGGGALAGRPTDLQIEGYFVYDGDEIWFGPGNSLQVALWVPERNAYVPIVLINDNQDPEFLTWVQGVTSGSPAAQNIIILEDNPVVTASGDIITVNLTVPVDIKFGDPLPAFWKTLNFTLPPITLEFHPIGAAFKADLVTTNPTSRGIQF